MSHKSIQTPFCDTKIVIMHIPFALIILEMYLEID